MSDTPFRLSIICYQAQYGIILWMFAVERRGGKGVLCWYADGNTKAKHVRLVSLDDERVINNSFVAEMSPEAIQGDCGLNVTFSRLSERNNREFIFEGMWKLYNYAGIIGYNTFFLWAPILTKAPEPIFIFAREEPSKAALKRAHLTTADIWIFNLLLPLLSAHDISTVNITAVGRGIGSTAPALRMLPGADLAIKWVPLLPSEPVPSSTPLPMTVPTRRGFEAQLSFAPSLQDVLPTFKAYASSVGKAIDLSQADLSTVSAARLSAARLSAKFSSSSHPPAVRPPAGPSSARPSPAHPLPESLSFGGASITGPPVTDPAAADHRRAAPLSVGVSPFPADLSGSEPSTAGSSVAGPSAAPPAAVDSSVAGPSGARFRRTPPRSTKSDHQDSPSSSTGSDPALKPAAKKARPAHAGNRGDPPARQLVL
jgi:hypothetical protein